MPKRLDNDELRPVMTESDIPTDEDYNSAGAYVFEVTISDP